eukprot:11217821-Lingulodinium_polyedra.AAC.1
MQPAYWPSSRAVAAISQGRSSRPDENWSNGSHCLPLVLCAVEMISQLVWSKLLGVGSRFIPTSVVSWLLPPPWGLLPLL